MPRNLQASQSFQTGQGHTTRLHLNSLRMTLKLHNQNATVQDLFVGNNTISTNGIHAGEHVDLDVGIDRQRASIVCH